MFAYRTSAARSARDPHLRPHVLPQWISPGEPLHGSDNSWPYRPSLCSVLCFNQRVQRPSNPDNRLSRRKVVGDEGARIRSPLGLGTCMYDCRTQLAFTACTLSLRSTWFCDHTPLLLSFARCFLNVTVLPPIISLVYIVIA
jgi:hypothetical protein